MAHDPKLSPNDTYVFDNEDLEELDELSLTSVMREADTTLNPSEDEPAGASSPETSEFVCMPAVDSTMDGTSINNLLEQFGPHADATGDAVMPESDTEKTGTFASDEVLLSPEEMFSKEDLE